MSFKVMVLAILVLLSIVCPHSTSAMTDDLVSSRRAYIFSPKEPFTDSRKRTALLFITADSSEPYMKIAIDKELHDLRQLCLVPELISSFLNKKGIHGPLWPGKSEITWATVLGSKMKYQLDHALPLTYETCEYGLYKSDNTFTPEISKAINEIYRTFSLKLVIPTAIPGILEAILVELTTLRFNNVRPEKYFVHIKGHGSKDYPILNIISNSSSQKSLDQYGELAKNPEDQERLKDYFERIELGKGKLLPYFNYLTKNDSQHLGGERSGGGLGSTLQSLSAEEKTFPQSAFESIFKNLRQKGVFVSFLFLESCSSPSEETQNGPDIDPWFKDEIPVYSYYMAKGYLGYHNLNWAEVIDPEYGLGSINNTYNRIKSRLPFIENRFPDVNHITHSLPDKAYISLPSQPTLSQAPTEVLRFKDLFIGGNSTCGINLKDELICWGEGLSHLPQIVDPGTSYTKVAANHGRFCGITTIGILKCWGQDPSNIKKREKLKESNLEPIFEINPTPIDVSTQYTDISISEIDGSVFGCGITAQYKLKCWGRAPSETFLSNHKSNSDQILEVDSNRQFGRVAVGQYLGAPRICSVTVEGDLVCWDQINPKAKKYFNGDRFKNLFANSDVFCALNVHNQIKCLEFSKKEPILYRESENFLLSINNLLTLKTGETFSNFSLGHRHFCAISSASEDTQCWGANNLKQIEIPDYLSRRTEDQIVKVMAGDWHSCALTKFGLVACWGANFHGQLGNTTRSPFYIDEPTSVITNEKFKAVRVGKTHSCGITLNDKLMCWGEEPGWQIRDGEVEGSFPWERYLPKSVDQNETYSQIEGFDDINCGLTQDGIIKCWGYSDEGGGYPISNPLPIENQGKFKKIIMIGPNPCGLSDEGRLICWRNPSKYENELATAWTTIESRWIDVAGGDKFGCGITKKFKVECWIPVNLLAERFSKGTITADSFNAVIPIPIQHLPHQNIQSIKISKNLICLSKSSQTDICFLPDLPGSTFEFNSIDTLIKHISEYFSKETMFNNQFQMASYSAHDFCGIQKLSQNISCVSIKTGISRMIDEGVKYKAIAVNSNSFCGITEKDHLKCWGDNEHGQLGIGVNGTRFQR